MKRNGYDQFFKQAKKNAELQAPSVKIPVQVSPQSSTAKLRENILKRKNKPVRAFPAVQFVSFLLCGAGLFLAIENFDQIESYINKIEIGLGVAQAEEAKPAEPKVTEAKSETKSLKSDAKPDAEKLSENKDVDKDKAMAKTDTDPDDADYIYKLAERKKGLDQREEELSKKSAEIESQKLAVEKKLKELEDYRSKISAMLQERIKADDSKVDTLVQVYTNMKPSQAAKIFESMDEDLVIEILSRMKKKSAADILNLVKTEKAQTFAEKYSGYRLPATAAKAENSTAPGESKNP